MSSTRHGRPTMYGGVFLSGLLHAAALGVLLAAWHWKVPPRPDQLIAVEIVVEEIRPEIPLERGPEADLSEMRAPRDDTPPPKAALEELPALPSAPVDVLPPVEEAEALEPQQQSARAEPPTPAEPLQEATAPEPVREAFLVAPPRRKPAQRETEEPEPVEEPLVQPSTPSEPPPAAKPAPPAKIVQKDPPDFEDVSPAKLLANLRELQDENLQAEKNPALWAVIRAVRVQVARCWTKGALAADQKDLTVDIRVAFEIGGQLNKADFVEVGRMVHDESYRDFAVTARDALRRCSPFALPPESYDLWQDFTMRFVSRLP